MKDQIIKTLKEKSVLKQKVYDQTINTFNILKNIIRKIVINYNAELEDDDARIFLECKEDGEFAIELKVAGDLLIFNMHSNVFEFPNNHEIWRETNYVERPLITYSGIINIYNFLADSFKYDRSDDLGYLLGRIFINKDASFFTDGIHELGFNYPVFNKNIVNVENLSKIIESAILYSLKFDLFVPNFNDVEEITVSYMKEKIITSKMRTAKRLGFKYSE